MGSIFSQWNWGGGNMNNPGDNFQQGGGRPRQFDFGNNGNFNNNNGQQNQQPSISGPPANFDSCYRSCQANVLKEFNPVCGSNQVTYDNRRLFNCAQRCGLQITEISQSTCTPSAGGK